jgi:O-antigen/teichoic acid export membrane protein
VNWAKSIFQSVFKLGVGELVSRLAMFAVLAVISRRFGLQLFGAVTLAQTVSLYAMQGTDLGFRTIGMRVVARDPQLAPMTVSDVLKKRSITGTLAIVAALIYGFYGPMPDYARLCVVGFVIGIIPYLFSLDWLAWGLSQFGWLSAWRAGVAVAFAATSFAGFRILSDARVALVVGNFVSMLLGSAVLWLIWRYRWKAECATLPGMLSDSREEFRWRMVLPLGITVILTQAFHNADTLLLGAMAPLNEVGRYSAAYRILFLAFGGYYLITQSIYPMLSRAPSDGGARKKIWLGLAFVTVAGTVVAIVLSAFAQPILTVIYGSDLRAVSLLRLLAIVVPLDFIATTVGMSFVSRGFDKYMLFSFTVAALSNIACNLVLIPQLGAKGAAIATLASYVLLNVCLVAGFVVLPVFEESCDVYPVKVGSGQVDIPKETSAD